MRWWIAKSGSSYVAPVAGIEPYGWFGEVPGRAFGPLGVHRRRQPLAPPDRDDRSGHPAEGRLGKIALAAAVVQQAGGPPGSRGRPVSFDFGDPQLKHGYDSGRACRTPG